MSSLSLLTEKSPFIFDVKCFFLGQKKENLGPYLYSTPSPEIENDLVYGEKYYQKLIYEVPDYYLYKDEVDVIKKYADSIANHIPLEATVIEFGPGTEKAFITKTLPLLKSIEKLKNYVAVDLCQTYLDQTKDLVEQEFNTYHFEWNEEEHCVKHNAIATESQSFSIDNTAISIKKGELFHVTSSYKYPTEFFQKMAINTGFKILDCFIDSHKRMAIYVLQASQVK